MSMTPPLDKIHHLALSVSNITTSVAWYRQKFNCEITYQDETWALLRFANVSMALVIPDQHPPHVGVLHANAAEFGPLTTHRDGTRSVYIPDPDGNMIEVMEAGRASS